MKSKSLEKLKTKEFSKSNTATKENEKCYETKKKKDHEELWNKVNENEELSEIVKLKEKLEQSNLNRENTHKKISDMKNAYDNMKKEIQTFIREQSSAFHKLNYPRRNKGRNTKNKNL